MREADMQSSFGNWLKANRKKTGAYELKITKTKYFYPSKLAPHQISNLELAKSGFFYHKIPDCGFQNPFDCVSLFKVPAYVVILYYQPRKSKNFYAIDITTFLGLIDDGIKSMPEEMAASYAEFSGVLK